MHRDDRNVTRSDQAELAALADGSLTGERRGEALHRIGESEELKALADEQALAVGLTRDASAVRAPASLRTAVRRLGTARPARMRRRALLAAAAAVAVVAAIVAVSLPADRGEPSFQRATAFGAQASTMPAPARDPARPAYLLPGVAGVSHPNWTRDYGFAAVGSRDDDFAGRRAVTVFYAGRSGDRIGYTIVTGRPLDVPRPVETVVRRGIAIDVLRTSGRRVVTWRRAGHTCILSGSQTSVARLVELAGSSAERD
jgi:hypothetical protein